MQDFDVIIVGGSYAGLSAAMALGRSLKRVLIIDSGKPCNRYTPYSHNLVTHDGTVPGEIAAKAKREVLSYQTVKWYEGKAVSGRKMQSGFEIITDTSAAFTGHKLVFASGIKDIFPDIKNFEACWGKSVIHCPYCHGYEFKGGKTAIVANGERAFHLTALVSNLTDKLSMITHEKPDFKDDQLARLQKNRIQIVEKEVREIEHQNGQVIALVFKDGTKENFDAVYTSLPFEQHCLIPIELGCETTEMGHLTVDMFQKTTVPGVYACGDNSSMMRSVSYAIAMGGIVGAMVNNEITLERF